MQSGLLHDDGTGILQIWTRQAIARLYWHLHNGNPPMGWVMGFCAKETGVKTYKRSKRIHIQRGISWAISSIEGKKERTKALTFVPYSTNPRSLSCWGGFDFDAHDGNVERARSYAEAALNFLLPYGFALIVEQSGNGWHVWVIAAEFKPVSFWIQLLKHVAGHIGARIEPGICEMLPHDSVESVDYGKGMRAPGSWNPGTNRCSLIHWHNADALISSLPAPPKRGRLPIGELAGSLSFGSSIEKEVFLSSLSFSQLGSLIGGVESYRITQRGARHNLMDSMLGAAIHQVSRPVGEALARAQYREKEVPANASETDHMDEFAELWQWHEKQVCERLSPFESERYKQLLTETDKAAFRILKSYARKAEMDGSADFPIVRDNLGDRLNMTPEGAGQLRFRFCKLGIIEQTARYRANVAAARYQWIADIDQPF